MITKVKRWLHKVTAPTTEPLPSLCDHGKGWYEWVRVGQFYNPDGVMYVRHCADCCIPQVKRVLWDRLGNGS